MGREQKRKEQFKNKNKKMTDEELDTSIKMSTIIKLVCFVVILLFVIYYVIAVFVTKEINISNSNNNNETSETDQNSSVVNDRILASNIFNQKEDTYYVYFYNFKDENELVKNAIASITDKVYKVDTSSSLNKNYVTEDNGNKKAQNIDELKVKDPTLIKIKDDKIVEYYEGSNDIYEGLN